MAPFFGVAVLMTIALAATAFSCPSPRPAGVPHWPTRSGHCATGGLLTVAMTALFYNVGFFTLLAFAPFPSAWAPPQVGWIFFGWGILLAFTSVVAAPWLERRLGPCRASSARCLFAADLRSWRSTPTTEASWSASWSPAPSWASTTR